MMSNLTSLQDGASFRLIDTSSSKEITWEVPSSTFNVRTSLDSPAFNFQNATWSLQLLLLYDDYSVVRVRLKILFSSAPCHNLRLRYILMWPDQSYDVELVESCGFWDVDFVASTGLDWSNTRNQSLRLTCQISSCGSTVVGAFSRTEEDVKDTVDLCQNLKNLLLNGQDHDLVLKVKSKEFRAHRSILRARSPVFQSMLSHDMVEKNSGVIDIPDCEPGAFAQFLFYIYTGKVETLDAGNMPALYYIADKYDMGLLKDKCRQFSKKSMTCANVSDVIQLALNHNDADLLECATVFFAQHLGAVLRTVEWQSFAKRNNTEANELLIKVADKLEAEKLNRVQRIGK